MKSEVKHILNKLENPPTNERKILKNSQIFRYHERLEEEQNKSEDQKRHERYVRKMKKMAFEPDIVVVPQKKRERKFGLEFEAPLSKLAPKYKTIAEIYKHFSAGQLLKYWEEEGKLYRHKDGRLAFDETTGECFE